MRDGEGQKALTSMLAQCFDVFPNYGKGPSAAASIVPLFHLALSDFDIDEIRQAFKFHLVNNKQFPVPADIAHIIRRGNKPPFSESYYVSLSRKDGDQRTPQEWQYIREYESYMRTGRY